MQVDNGAAEGSGLGLEPAMPLDVTNETPAAARVQLYQTQSCVFITTRILVVDFLVHRLQPSQVWPLKLLLCPSAEGRWLAHWLLCRQECMKHLRQGSDGASVLQGRVAPQKSPQILQARHW